MYYAILRDQRDALLGSRVLTGNCECVLQLAGAREVKARVKLRFTNVAGKLLTCTRTLQLTQQAKKMTLKTLESALRFSDEKGDV